MFVHFLCQPKSIKTCSASMRVTGSITNLVFPLLSLTILICGCAEKLDSPSEFIAVARQHERESRYPEAAAAYKQALSLDTKNPIAWYDLGVAHSGTSNPRTLIIVSEDEKRAELTDRQAALLLDLERATAALESAHQNTNELKLQLEEAGELRLEDRDVLKRVELDQRQVESRLTGGSNSLQNEARKIAQERSDNLVDDATSETLLD